MRKCSLIAWTSLKHNIYSSESNKTFIFYLYNSLLPHCKSKGKCKHAFTSSCSILHNLRGIIQMSQFRIFVCVFLSDFRVSAKRCPFIPWIGNTVQHFSILWSYFKYVSIFCVFYLGGLPVHFLPFYNKFICFSFII